MPAPGRAFLMLQPNELTGTPWIGIALLRQQVSCLHPAGHFAACTEAALIDPEQPSRKRLIRARNLRFPTGGLVAEALLVKHKVLVKVHCK